MNYKKPAVKRVFSERYQPKRGVFRQSDAVIFLVSVKGIKMRSTLTLESDVAHQIQELVATSRKPFKTVVNDPLRQGLAAKSSKSRERFVQPTFALGWNDTLDPTGLNRLADQLALKADIEVLTRFETSQAKW